jgi:acyl-CoA thioester hydrolase
MLLFVCYFCKVVSIKAILILNFIILTKKEVMKNIFEAEFKVELKDIDDLNHVNNAVYVKWMDEVAFKHWAYLTRNKAIVDTIWVVNRHEIDYKSEAFLGDKITAKTYVGDTKGVTSERIIEFYKDNTLLVKSKTIWVLLDAKSYKPVRIRENILNLLQPFK